jgi:tetratricopeptide (TPR) repeat protein
VLALAPDNTKGFNNLGATIFNQGRTDEGAEWWEKSMLVRPTNTAASNLGSYYYSHGRYRDASRAYERAIAISSSQNYQIWVNLGAALFWTPGERSKASAAYVKAVKLAEDERRVNPREPEILASLADSYSILERRTEARAAIAAVERLEARDPDILFTVASACEQMGERDRALQWLEKAIAAGYDRAGIERSPWLEALRKDERFVQMMRKSDP